MRWRAKEFDVQNFVQAGGVRLRTVAVCGSRDFDDFPFMVRRLDEVLYKHTREIERSDVFSDRRDLIFVSGNNPRRPRPKGVDDMVVWYCGDRIVPHIPFAADWETYGRAAGPIRNGRMLREAGPDLLVAFPGGNGTIDCCRQADGRNIPVWEIEP
jgi:hypothetical protein